MAEVWIYDGETLKIQQLRDDRYIPSETSQFFPRILASDIAQFLQRAEGTDYLQLVKSFRSWVQGQIQP